MIPKTHRHHNISCSTTTMATGQSSKASPGHPLQPSSDRSKASAESLVCEHFSFDRDEERNHNKDHPYYRPVSDLLTMTLKLAKELSTRAAMQYLRDRRKVLRSGKLKQWSSMMKGARKAKSGYFPAVFTDRKGNTRRLAQSKAFSQVRSKKGFHCRRIRAGNRPIPSGGLGLTCRGVPVALPACWNSAKPNQGLLT